MRRRVMTLGELISKLQTMNQTTVLANGFTGPHSWRGAYSELAFEPADNISVAELLSLARRAVGEEFEGYKGGTYRMDYDTPVHLDMYGESSGYEESEAKMEALFGAVDTLVASKPVQAVPTVRSTYDAYFMSLA